MLRAHPDERKHPGGDAISRSTFHIVDVRAASYVTIHHPACCPGSELLIDRRDGLCRIRASGVLACSLCRLSPRPLGCQSIFLSFPCGIGFEPILFQLFRNCG